MSAASSFVVDYDAAWPAHFVDIRASLGDVFGADDVAIEHIGSTSVPGLAAKPVVDVMLGAPSLAAIEARIAALQVAGWEYVARHEAEMPMRRYFVRPAGATPRVHLHAVVRGSTFWREHLAFRDALRADPDLAARYAQLKRQLAQAFAQDRAAYSAAKAPFIRAVVETAPGR